MQNADEQPPIGEPLKRGEHVRITCGERTVDGFVSLASPNGRSLVVMFDAMLDGHLGVMPVYQLDDGSFVALMTNAALAIERNRQRMH